MDAGFWQSFCFRSGLWSETSCDWLMLLFTAVAALVYSWGVFFTGGDADQVYGLEKREANSLCGPLAEV